MNSLSIESLKGQIHEAFSLWHRGSSTSSPPPLADLLIVHAAQADGQTQRRAINQVLLNALAQLDRQDAQGATLLRLRFSDDQPAQIVANRLNISEGHVFKKQRESIEMLADILIEEELAARSALQDRLGRRMDPPTYTQLFGVDTALNDLVQILMTPGPPGFVSLEGIGGIGKTSLTHALIKRLVDEGIIGWRTFTDLGWVTAHRQVFTASGTLLRADHPALSPEHLVYDLAAQLLPDVGASRLSLEQTTDAVAHRLRADPHLIVIDNLETRADVEAVLETVRQWTDPADQVPPY